VLSRFLESGEKRFQSWQGKGFGGRKSLIAEIRAAISHLPVADAVVFDIGANRGEWTSELLARAGGRVGRVYCFEPAAAHHAALEAIGDPRVTLIKKAIADTAGPMTLYADRNGSGLASLVQRDLRHANIAFAPVATVDVTTVDGVIDELGIDVVHFAKFDIEGLEYRALCGAERALDRGKIRALAFEFGGTDIDSRTYFRDFWRYLTPRGYKLALVNPLGAPRLLKRYSERQEVFQTSNFVAWKDMG
jgi:FkbM family methyltransferase